LAEPPKRRGRKDIGNQTGPFNGPGYPDVESVEGMR